MELSVLGSCALCSFPIVFGHKLSLGAYFLVPNPSGKMCLHGLDVGDSSLN